MANTYDDSVIDALAARVVVLEAQQANNINETQLTTLQTLSGARYTTISARLDAIEARLTALEARVADSQARVAALESA